MLSPLLGPAADVCPCPGPRPQNRRSVCPHTAPSPGCRQAIFPVCVTLSSSTSPSCEDPDMLLQSHTLKDPLTRPPLQDPVAMKVVFCVGGTQLNP